MEQLNLLILEDTKSDRELVLALLRSKGFKFTYDYCDTFTEFKKLIKEKDYNFIISDYNLKEGTGLNAIEYLKSEGLDIPFVIVSGSIDDEQAIQVVLSGASDYVLKAHLQRLAVVIEREFKIREERREKERLDHFFDSVFENANVGLKICELDGTILRVNKAYTRISGYSKEELVGNNIMIVVPPDQIDEAAAEYEVFMQDRLPRSVERQFIRKDGSAMNVQISSEIVDSGDGDLLYLSVLDISELAESRELLEQTSKMTKIGGWEVDLRTEKITWTDQIYEIHGVDTDFEITLEKALEFYDEDGKITISNAVQTLIEEGTPYDEVVGFVDANGAKKWVRSAGSAKKVLDKVVLLSGTFQDVTDQRNKEIELERAKASYEELFKKSPNPVLLLNGDNTKIIDVNEAAIEKYGYAKDEFLELNPIEMRPDEDFNFFKSVQQQRAANKDPVFKVNHVRHKKKNGDIIFVDIQARDIEMNDGRFDIIQITDITEKVNAEIALIESEKEYRSLVEASNYLISKLTPEGVLTFTNSGCEKVLGYPPEEVIGRNMMEFVVPEDIPMAAESFKRVLEGKSEVEIEVRSIHKDGNIRNISVSAYPNFAADGSIVSIGATAYDITYLKTYQKRLEDSIDEKEVLIKEIHHRVKNNLAVVSGLLELQSLKFEDNELYQVLQESQARIKSIAIIHEKLYQSELFTQIDAGRYLEDLAMNISDAYTMPNKDIKLEFDLEPIHLNVNQAVPFGILANELISNAYKHAFEKQDEGIIKICLIKEDLTVTFAVQDDGIGLEEDFDPIKEGSLGFTLILNLADQLDGKISWKNLKRGSEFRLTFDPNELARTWASISNRK